MSEILGHLKSPGWWFSVVIAGLIVSFVSFHLNQWTTHKLSKLSVWCRAQLSKLPVRWRERIRNTEMEFGMDLVMLLGIPGSLSYCYQRTVESRLRLIAWALFGIMAVVLYQLRGILGLVTYSMAEYSSSSKSPDISLTPIPAMVRVVYYACIIVAVIRVLTAFWSDMRWSLLHRMVRIILYEKQYGTPEFDANWKLAREFVDFTSIEKS